MTLPRHVLWFEVLLYMSLMLDALSVALQDRTPTLAMTESRIMVANLIAAGLILTFFYLVRLAARGRKNWPRWVLTVSLVQIVGDSGLQLDSFIEVFSCFLTASGLYFSFTGDAQGWFNA